MICFVTRGSGAILINGALHRIQPFELYFLGPGMVVETVVNPEPIEYYAVVFEPVTIIKTKGQFSIYGSPTFPPTFYPGRIPLGSTQHAFAQMLSLYEESRKKPAADDFSLRLRLEELLHTLTSDLSEQEQQRDTRIDQSITHMRKHLSEKITLNLLADAAGLSPSSFSRLFRKATGILPNDFLTRLRIDEAKKRLTQADSRVKEVSAAVGFSNEFYFSRTFHRIVGVSPSIYIKRRQLRIAVASSLGFRDNFAAIGVTPVVTVDLFRYPWMNDEEYEQLYAAQMNEIREARPDLIVGDHYHLEVREQLKQISPTILFDFPAWDWRVNQMKLAELVNREREAEQVITRLDLRLHEVRSELKSTLGKERITIMQVNHRAIGIQGTCDHPLNEMLYSKLEFTPGNPVPDHMWRIEMAPELMPCLETDRLFIQQHHLRAGSDKIFTRLQETPSWKAMDVVKNNRVQLIPNWFLMSWTPAGRDHILDSLLSLHRDSAI